MWMAPAASSVPATNVDDAAEPQARPFAAARNAERAHVQRSRAMRGMTSVVSSVPVRAVVS